MCIAAGVGGSADAPVLTSAAKYLAARLYIGIVCAGDPAKGATYDGIAKLYAEVYEPLLKAYFAGVPVPAAIEPTLQNVPRVRSERPVFMHRRFL